MNIIDKAIKEIGLQPLANGCGLTYQAVLKWKKRGRLPRTDYTGETKYYAVIVEMSDGKITKEQLLKQDGL